MPFSTVSSLTSESLTNVAEPAWVRDMQSHFAQTGAFRVNDVHRVLGNPWDGVALHGTVCGTENGLGARMVSVVSVSSTEGAAG